MNAVWFAWCIALAGVALALATPQPRLRRRNELPRARWSYWVLAVLLMVLGAFYWQSPTAGLAGPAALGLSYRAVRRLRRRSARQRMQRALPQFTDDLAQQLRSGSSLSGSLVRVADDSPEVSLVLAPTLRALASGDRLGAALQRVESNDEALRLVLVTIGLLVVAGGPAADTIERTGENVRSVVAGQEEAKALAGQGTASAVVLAVLPALFALLAGLSNQSLARFYLFDWVGAACVTSSVLLIGASWFWMDVMMWGRG